MMSDQFESAFEQFLESEEYEKTEELLFSLVRLAFAAGWKAAGGEDSKADKPQE